MAPELSSNWKKLQAQIKAEPSSTPKKQPQPDQPGSTKRKSPQLVTPSSKRQKPNVQPAKKEGEKKQRQRNWPVKPPPPASASSSMGVTQSSAIPKGTSATITPSLALWADDNGISTEALAEAYNLGVKDNALLKTTPADAERHRVNEGLAPSLKISDVGKYIGLDCEMVGIGPDGYDHALARVSVVDFHGKQVYDSFVRPREKVTDWRTSITGITTKHMRTAREFYEVQQVIADLLKDRVLVGHDIRHDLAVLMLSHPTHQVRDTARFSGYRKYGHGPKPALRTLAREVLGVEIQGGVHSSIEDARVAMLLFRKKKPEFDVENAHKFSKFIRNDDGDDAAGVGANGKGRTKGAGGKKKKNKH